MKKLETVWICPWSVIASLLVSYSYSLLPFHNPFIKFNIFNLDEKSHLHHNTREQGNLFNLHFNFFSFNSIRFFHDKWKCRNKIELEVQFIKKKINRIIIFLLLQYETFTFQISSWGRRKGFCIHKENKWNCKFAWSFIWKMNASLFYVN